MLECSCLCGLIKFNVQEVKGMTFNCHCSRCRKSHGSAFSTQVVADKKTLKFTTGKDQLTEFSSSRAIRTFCSNCGSRLMNYDRSESRYLSVAISAIDNNNDFVPAGECYSPEKLNFVKLEKSIPHFKELPELKPL